MGKMGSTAARVGLVLVAVTALAAVGQARVPDDFFELTTGMNVDVDGAPNAYGPAGKPALDVEINAHYLERLDQPIVGYLLDESQRPILQRAGDPFPGYYISTTSFFDDRNANERDPRRYLDARQINYVVRGDEAERRGAQVGDFVAVYSTRTHKAVYAVVGDTGNPQGNEGSLHLLQDLGYPFHDGISDSVTRREIVIRFFPRSNPRRQFFFTQAALTEAAAGLGLDRNFSNTRSARR